MRRLALVLSVFLLVGLVSFSCASHNSGGGSDSSGDAPAANFTGSPLSGDPPLAVTFTSTSTGDITSYAWDFGDGGSSGATNPVHTYETDGSYNVSLTVVGPGGSDTETKTAYITCGNPPGPTVEFSADPLLGSASLTVDFTDQSSGNNVHAWSWSFGDGGTSTQQNPQYIYNNAGTYDVTLLATDDDGTKSLTKNAFIEVSSGVTVDPPLGGSSGGSGGGTSSGQINAGGVTCNIIVPSSYSDSVPNPFLIVYSGTEGMNGMHSNLINLRTMCGLGAFIIVTLDGTYHTAQNGADVLVWVRSNYNIDNDRTSLLSESAGTVSGLYLAFGLPSYFAAYWANDVNYAITPQQTAAELGFAPWGNAGPGGQLAIATTIVNGMRDAGYRLPADAPYSGPGWNDHGNINQLIAALQFFPGKSRQ